MAVPGQVPSMDVKKRFSGEKKENVGTMVKRFNYKPIIMGKIEISTNFINFHQSSPKSLYLSNKSHLP